MLKPDHPYRPAWPATELYVSPRGHEKWSGRMPEPNAYDSDGPLPSLAEALAQLRHSPPAGPATIYLEAGMHFLDEPLAIGPETPPVTIAARNGAAAVLSGGRLIEGLAQTTHQGVRAWVAMLPQVAAGQWFFRSLYVNGAPRPRPRLPREGTYRIVGVPGMRFDRFIGPPEAHHSTFYCEPGQVRAWKNLADVDAVAFHYWMEERLPLADVDPESGRVEARVRPWFPLKDDAAARCARVRFENVAEALTEPGQWYLDRAAGVLTYLPLPGEELDNTRVIAPVLDHLVRIEGRPDQPVRGVMLRDLALAHVDWRPISGRGTDAQAAFTVSAVVRFAYAGQCGMLNCRVGPAGPYGVELGPGCRGNRIAGCRFEGLGAGGIKIVGDTNPAGRCSHSIIEDNRIARCTDVFPSAVGILVIHSDHNVIRGNHIHDLEYSGISCGWIWGHGDNPTHHCLIQDNHIHHLGSGLLNDMGGIYTLGEQPGTVLRRNHIHHIRAGNYGGWAIYLDEGSSYIVVEENLLHHTSSECLNLHYGRENLVRNNVMAFSGLGVVSVSAVAADGNSMSLERNILLADNRPVLVARDRDRLTQRGFRSDLNVLWDHGGREVFAGDEDRDQESRVTWQRYSVAQLRELGYERHSQVADPLLVNPAEGDFRLRPGSPAAALGFLPFVAAGARVEFVGSPKRRANPVTQDESTRGGSDHV